MTHFDIETSALTRRFGELVAVDQLALRVPKGAVYGFLGANGAGKTTTIRMLLGLIRPDQGSIRLLGREVEDRRERLSTRVGALVESPSLYSNLTGRENLEVTRRMLGTDKNSIDEALDTVSLTSAANRKAGRYSLGMKQRLGLAQALIGNPEILILDEPTNGLDPSGIQEIRKLVRNLARERGVTVFLSSHLLSEVEQVADAVGIIHNGMLRFQGGMDELAALSRPNIVIGVRDVPTAERVLRAEGLGVTTSDNGMLRVADAGSHDAAAINAMLVAAGVGVFRITEEKPTLEDIFLSMIETRGSGSC